MSFMWPTSSYEKLAPTFKNLKKIYIKLDWKIPELREFGRSDNPGSIVPFSSNDQANASFINRDHDLVSQ